MLGTASEEIAKSDDIWKSSGITALREQQETDFGLWGPYEFQMPKKEGKWEERITVIGSPDRVKTVFAEAIEKIDQEIKANTSDLEALKKAMKLEERGEKLYNGLSEKATNSFEKRFFLTLATEERGHFLLILDSFDYLSDPAGWFAQKERSGLDGG